MTEETKIEHLYQARFTQEVEPIYKNKYKAGLTKFRAIEHILTRMQAVARIFASTHVICEQFEQMPNFAGTSFQINENIRYPSFCPRML